MPPLDHMETALRIAFTTDIRANKSYTPTPNTMIALNKSIKTWIKRSTATYPEQAGMDSCPLCHLFHPSYVGERFKTIVRREFYCRFCPIKEYTGKRTCRDTPYTSYNDELRQILRVKLFPLGSAHVEYNTIRQIALLEVKFLLDVRRWCIKQIYKGDY